MRNVRFTIAMSLVAGFATLTALAETATISVSDPMGNGVVTVTVTRPDGTVDTIPISVMHVMNATDKRDQIAVNLFGRGYNVQSVGLRGVKIKDLPKGTTVAINAGTTAEQIDRIVASAAHDSQIQFGGVFDPIAPDGFPADFTAGFVTADGSFLAQVTAEELEFQTDGANIALALFERLVQPAADLGVELELVGDGIRVSFPGPLSTETGGVVFGTTSPSEGLSGGLLLGQSITAVPAVRPQRRLLDAEPPSDPNATAIEFGAATGAHYCEYLIVSSNCTQLRSGDYVCVNCNENGDCANTIAFKVINGSDEECHGRWGNAYGNDHDCQNCVFGGKTGWKFH